MNREQFTRVLRDAYDRILVERIPDEHRKLLEKLK